MGRIATIKELPNATELNKGDIFAIIKEDPRGITQSVTNNQILEYAKSQMRCKNCKSYKKSYMYNYTGSIMNHFCNNDKLCEWICSDKSDDQLIYEYDEHGTFFPGENFGCIHFEDKE